MALESIRGPRAAAGPQARAPLRAQGAAGFAVPLDGNVPAQEAAASSGVGAAGMLSLQEQPQPQAGDRPARRRGQDMLDELAALQRDMLTAQGPTPATLRRLACLAEDVPVAQTAALAEAVAAIKLRAVVELARYDLSQ